MLHKVHDSHSKMADEDVAALKKSCNGYLGVMSRYYKELEVLFTDPKNYDEVLKKTSELQGIFESYESKCKVYISKLPEKEAEGASERLEHERKNKLEFEKRLAEWMQTVAKVTEPETSIQKEVDAISVRSAQSTTSSVRLKEAQAKRALAALKREQLEKTQRLQEQQLKLEQELERLNVEHEIINAEAELQVWEEEEVLQTGSELKRGKDQSPAGNSNIADKQSEKPNELCSTLNPNAPEYAGGQSVLPEISGTTQIEPQPDGGLSQIMKTLNMSINMPKPDLQVFRGDPSDYYTFINNFETSVANKLSEDRQKLTYLLQFCGGDAKDSIACCVLMDSSSGYRKAREILAQQFGQPHVVAHSLIDKVVNRPAIKPNEYKSLAELSRQMRKCEVTLSQSGYTADLNSTDTLIKIQQLLPMYMKKEWAKRAQNQIGRNIVPNFRHMTDFVEEHARIANNIFGRSISGKRETQSHGMSSGGQRLTTLSTQSTSGREMPKRNPRKCACCSGDHPIDNCKELRDKPQKERFKFVRRNRLCDNCLKPNHVASKCRYPPGCQVEGCGRRHHTLIHFIRSESQSEQTQMGAGGGSESQVQDVGTSASVITSQKVCLRVLPVKVRGNGREVTTMALLDQGSDTTLCAKALAKELGFSEGERQFEINTVNGPSKVKYGSEISLSIQGACEEGIIEIPAVWTVDQLPVSERSIPRQEDIQGYSHLKGITLSVCNKEVRLLIGSDTPEAFWVQEERRGGAKEPYAVRTPLGWTLLGPMSHMKERKVCFTVHHVSQDSLQTQLKRFWELDHLCGDSGEKQGESQEDRKARSMMEKSAVLVEGHYEIALPWRHYPPEMPENWNMAVSRMQSLGRRLERDGNLQVLYKAEIDAYVKRGYAREVASEDVGERGRVWYLPHHAVTHPAKPGRVRVVFDCAAQQRGISLNKRLLQGPDHTNNLIGVLTRFRQEKIALVADIESMFSQVRVSPGDTDFLRFLWWQDGDPSKPLKKYQMLVHLFGATSSPSCAGFALQKTAEDNREKYPGEVYQSVQDNFYVDDYLGCASTKGDAIILMKNLCHMLKAGGFRLTKWGSNDKEVLSEVPTAERAASLIDLDLDHLPVGRTLGVLWDIEKDMFTFGVSVEDVPTTRRGILSATSSLFDPLGFIAPYTLEAKFLLQDLCAKGLGWDEYVGDDELQRWKGWLAELSDLQQVEISRCFMPSSFDGETFDLHLFSDASERGYAASAYMRISNEKGEVHCVFVLGKARLCPLKRITIPRLELSAALLAVKLSQVIKDELRMPISSVTYWTDSTAVLMYIRNESRRFKTFVANRVAKIREATEVTQWRYVPTNLNPADDGSRGLHAWELTQDSRWLNGPDFLWKEKDVWPATPEGVTRGKLQENEDLLQEVKSTASQSFMSESKGSISSWLERYSSWTRLKRGVAWVLRYKKYLLAKLKRQLYKPEKILTVPELQQAEREIVKYIQRDVFEDEIKMARRGKDERLGKNSALRKLNPILVDEILRVGGRLKNAPVNDDVKHPVVMPSDHHVTRLIVVHYHRLIGHSGSGMTWAAVRNKYWILRGGATVRHVIGKCLECRKRNAVCGQQLMGELPAERVTPNKPPFAYVGIDYFGPLYIKQGRSQVKRWGCVFTCLTVRAVHIELAESLSTDSFINALRRFISRRGPPEKVFSDNGSNFKSGEKELREALRELNDMKVGDYLHQREIEWHFNPPTGSHMGGIWERVIRSVRQILKGLLKEQIVNQEVLTTVVAEVEAILNSRPLTQISLDPADAEPLTPNHLLLMRKSPNVPPGLFTKADGYGRRQWRQSQYLANQFWRRWVKEYLPLLQVRQKWQKRSRNFQVNDLVLVAEDGVPRGQWSVGRVERVFPDEGGNVRQVEVRLGQKVYRRPIVKLCLLEGCDERL